MSCDLCDCDDHVNRPCPTCKNCIGHYVQTADYDEVHYDFSDEEPIKCQIKKPHYKYNGKSGKITEVIKDKDTIDPNFILDTFGG